MRRLSLPRWTRCIAVACALTTVAPAALADNAAIAEALFVEGRNLMKEKRYAEAVEKLKQSMRIERKVGTLLNIAVAEQKLGRTASAWASFTSAASLSRRAGQSEREAFAQKNADELAPKLSKVTFVAGDLPSGAVLRLDDLDLEAGTLGIPIPLDPGKHQISLKAPGKKTWRHEFDVAPGPATSEVKIPALEDEPAAAPPPTPPPVPAAPPAPPVKVAPAPPPPPPDEGPWAAVTFTGFGVGAAGIIVGAITGGMALSQSSDLDAACPGGACPESEHGNLDTMTTLSHVSTAGFAVGGAGLAVGVVGMILWQGDDSAEQAKVRVTPLVPVTAGSTAGLSMSGSF